MAVMTKPPPARDPCERRRDTHPVLRACAGQRRSGTEDLEDVRIDTNFGTGTSTEPIPDRNRMIEPNHFVFIVVDGRSAGTAKV
jgi:hypothetical protein